MFSSLVRYLPLSAHQLSRIQQRAFSSQSSSSGSQDRTLPSRSTQKHLEQQLRELREKAELDKLYKQLIPVRSFIQLQSQIRPIIPLTFPTDNMSNTPVVINGTATAKNVRQQLKAEIEQLVQSNNGVAPCLAVVLVGERKDSQTYVNMKSKACNEVGITPVQHNVSADISEAELAKLVTQLNNDSTVNGILIQLPLPAHINQFNIIELIQPCKDVDGLTLVSAGQVYSHGMAADLIACTPLGCIHLLDEYKIDISGKHAVVLGRSQLVGKPIASLLLSRNATVTICHSKTADIASIVRQADIVIAAIGKPRFVQRDWLKSGATVIDVGINAVDDSTDKRGYKLVGDVDYEHCADICSAITPVPGGVGPMTVAMLLKNTVKAYKTQHKIQS